MRRLVATALGTLLALAASAAQPGSGVHIVDQPADGGVELAITNSNPGPVTVTVTVTGKNAMPDREMPVVVSCAGPGTYPFVRLRPVKEDESFSWRVRLDWQRGQAGVAHDPAVIYELPFASGKAFVVGQGFHGSFTHTGNSEYAVDFDLPMGTEVRAARAGVVTYVEDNNSQGGLDPSLRDKANVIEVRHSDGTLGEYVHLRKGGARVKPGQKVRVHDLIGLSGNVGYSRGPHLHFSVFRAVDGTTRETFPIRFRAREGAAVEPVEGQALTAP